MLADTLSRMFEEPETDELDQDDYLQALSCPVLAEIPHLFGDLRIRQDEDPLWGPTRRDISRGAVYLIIPSVKECCARKLEKKGRSEFV